MRNWIRVLGVAALVAATPAIASEGFVGASLGVMDVEEDAGGLSFSDTPAAYKVFGGFNFNDNFGLELSYVSTLEDAEDTVAGIPVEVSLDAFVLRGVGAIQTSDKFSILGSVGYWDGDFEASGAGVAGSGSDDGITLGLGGKYRFDTVSIRGEIEWFDSDISIWTVLLGIQVNFGN